jgi:hypothetical protein
MIFFRLLIFTCLALSCFSAVGQSVTYSCEGDYHPIDFTFDVNGVLYSSSAYTVDHLLFNVDGDKRLGGIFQHGVSECLEVTRDWHYAYGLVTLLDGTVCATAGGGSIFCRNNNVWKEEFHGLAMFSLGITVFDDRILVVGEGRPPLDSYSSPAAILLPGFEPFAPDSLAGRGNFVAVADNGEVFMTTVTWDPDIPKLLFTSVDRFYHPPRTNYWFRKALVRNELRYPTGLLILKKSLLVSDFLGDELIEYSRDEELLARYPNFQGPMSIKQAPNGDICIAEYKAGQISCYSLESLRSRAE